MLVIEWGSTKTDAVQYALRNAPGVQENIVGAVLNKVDMASMSRYDSYGADYYYYGQNGHSVNLTMLQVNVGVPGARRKREMVSRSHAGKERAESAVASRCPGI